MSLFFISTDNFLPPCLLLAIAPVGLLRAPVHAQQHMDGINPPLVYGLFIKVCLFIP
jgi:hypothetical protein